MICLSESFLDSSISFDNENPYIKDHKLVRADQPGKVKRGGLSVYFKESITVRRLPNPYLKDCLIVEVSINHNKSYVVLLYWLPSQAHDNFNSFSTNFDKP